MRVKYVLSFIVVLMMMLACSAAAFPAREDPTPMGTFPPINSANLSQSVSLVSIPFSEEGQTPVYTITAQIPNLTGNDDPRVQAFNSELKDIVQKEVDSFKENTLQYAATSPISAGSSLDVRYTLIGQRGDVWSIKFDVSYYYDGAAHPGDYSVPVNYDLEHGRDLTLDELFLPGSHYLEAISQYCKSELSKRDIAFDMFSQGADPTSENYRSWNISDDGLMITFDEYQVAPYAAGPQVVVIPFSELEQLINHQSPLAPFIQ
jgi:hypothetical protein